MTKYVGTMDMKFWLEADSQEDADNKLNTMLDQWDKATPEEITWDFWDRTMEQEREEEN